MKIVGTLMVRDEVDVVAAMVEHHLAQGLDLLVVTDNGSVDGTEQVLRRYAETGRVELHHDPEHRKQQSTVVTRMARRARTEHAADWVLNLDADEFWVPRDRSLTLREALERTPLDLNAFTVPVTNLVGPASEGGSWVDRLTYRDTRGPEQLAAVGIHAHPTDDAVHRGESDVTVAQGNHFVSLSSNGRPDPEVDLEVLHVPWRSWRQVEQKVVLAGRAYEANPELRPSPNHHGMADYRRHVAGRLRYLYALRLPPRDVLDAGVRDGSFVADTWLREHLRGLALGGHALRPDLLAPLVQDAEPDLGVDEHAELLRVGGMLVGLEQERAAEAARAAENRRLARRLGGERDAARAALAEARQEVKRLRTAARPSPTPPLPQDLRRVAGRLARALRRRAGRARRSLVAAGR